MIFFQRPNGASLQGRSRRGAFAKRSHPDHGRFCRGCAGGMALSGRNAGRANAKRRKGLVPAERTARDPHRTAQTTRVSRWHCEARVSGRQPGNTLLQRANPTEGQGRHAGHGL